VNPITAWLKSAVGIATAIALIASLTFVTWKIISWKNAAVTAAVAAETFKWKAAVAEGEKAAEKILADQRKETALAREEAAKAQAEFNRTLKVKQNDLRKVTANLAICKLNADTIRLLNDAARAATASTN
jgi:hypothetical protein